MDKQERRRETIFVTPLDKIEQRVKETIESKANLEYIKVTFLYTQNTGQNIRYVHFRKK